MNFVLALFLVALQIVFCVITIRKNAKWKLFYAFLVISYVVSVALAIYFEILPGDGFMPGLSHLGDWMAAFFCSVASILILFISICIKIVRDEKSNNNTPAYLLAATVLLFAGAILITGDIYVCSIKIAKDYFVTYSDCNAYFYIPCFLLAAVCVMIRKKKMHKYE